MKATGALALGAALVLAGGAVYLLLDPRGPAAAPPVAVTEGNAVAGAVPAATRPPDTDEPASRAREAKGPGVILGRLWRFRTRAPLAGTVRVTGPGGEAWSAEAGPGGGFRLEGLPCEVPLAFEASFPGLASHRTPEVVVRARSPLDLGGIRLGLAMSLEVRVTDAAGAPVAGAAVSIHRGGEWLEELEAADGAPVQARAVADAAGAAVFRDLGPDSWIVDATAPGKSKERRSADLEEGEPPAPVLVVLADARTLEGRVLEADGKPVPRAEVAALRAEKWSDAEAPRSRATSDGEGRFRIDGLAPGRHLLGVRSFAGVAESAGSFEAGADLRRDIILAPRSALRGRVLVAKSGEPVPDATVLLQMLPRDLRDPQGTAAVARATTGAAGAFSLERIPAGFIARLSVEAEGLLDYPFPGDPPNGGLLGLAAGATPVVEIRMRRGGSVRGVVRDREGRPVPDAWIGLTSGAGAKGWVEVSTHSDGDGNYRIPAAAPGRGLLEAGAMNLHLSGVPEDIEEALESGTLPPECSVDVPDGGEVVMDLVLSPDCRVEGRMLRGDGTPAAGLVPVLVAPEEDEGWRRGAPSGADGSFVLENMTPDPGEYRVGAQGVGGMLGFSETFPLSESAVVRDVMVTVGSPGGIEGRVRRVDGKPAAGATVRLVPARFDPEAPWRWRFEEREGPTAPAGAQGEFRFDGLAPGEWTPVVSAPGCVMTRGDCVKLGDGERRAGIEILLPTERTLSGRVDDPSGNPLAGAKVTAMPLPRSEGDNGEESADTNLLILQAMGESAGTATSDAAGAFRIGGLTDGRFSVNASRAGRVPAAIVAEAGAEHLVLVLQEGLDIRGRAVEKGTVKGIAGLHVSVSGYSGGPLTSEDHDVRTGPDGSFALDGLAGGGRYGISFQDWDDEVWAPRTVKGVAAGTTDLVVEIERGLSIEGRVVDASGSPLDTRNLQVELAIVGAFFGSTTSTEVDEDGSFRFRALAPGRYRLTAGSGWESRAAYASRSVEVEAGTRDVAISLSRGRTISGRFLLPAGTAPGDDISLTWRPSRGSAPGSPPWNDSVRKDGTFETAVLDDGVPHDLDAEWGEKGLVGSVRDVMPGTTGIVIPLGKGRALEGRVLGPDGKVVGAGVEVRAERASDGEDVGRAETREDGTFVLDGLGAGEFRLFASADEPCLAPVPAERTWTAGATDAVVRTTAGNTLRIVFTEADGTAPELGAVLMEKTWEGRTTGPFVMAVQKNVLTVHGLPECKVRVKPLRSGEGFDGEEEGWSGLFDVPGPERTVTLP